MWAFVHTFPGGYRPQPKIVLEKGAVVSVEKTTAAGTEEIVKVLVQSGAVRTTNVPIPQRSESEPATSGSFTVQGADVTLPATAEALLTATGEDHGPAVPVSLLAPEVVLAGSKEKGKFGVRGVPVVLAPGVKVEAADVLSHFVPSAFNPACVKVVARWDKAKEMAVNVYSAFWTLCVSLLVTIVVSLFTRPKPDSELKNLVMGLTPRPDEGPCPWYHRPLLWATLIALALVAINYIYF
jgi:hypothetical protein